MQLVASFINTNITQLTQLQHVSPQKETYQMYQRWTQFWLEQLWGELAIQENVNIIEIKARFAHP